MPDERLYRTASGLEIRAGDEGDGLFEGYAVTWDFVDSYRSMFKKGSFTKTLQERGDKIKVKFDHSELVGKVLEAREDDKGLYVRGKLNLAVQAAKDVYEFLRDGTLDGLSFAFRSVKDHYEKGVRVFDEVQLYEIGPVCDPASDAAVVTAVRDKDAKPIKISAEGLDKELEGIFIPILERLRRAMDFNQTHAEKQARSAFWLAFMALEETLHDIWYMGRQQGSDAVLAMLDQALSDAHGALLEAAQQHIETLWNDENRSAPGHPRQIDLAVATRDWLAETRQTPEVAAENSPLTLFEVIGLMRGDLIGDKAKLPSLPPAVQVAHRQLRRTLVESLCKELREGLSPAEHQRISALLSRSKPEPSSDTPDTEPDVTSAIVESMRSFRASMRAKDHA